MTTNNNIFQQFWNAGYVNLVPIVPPTAETSATSSLAKAKGKAVGIKGASGLWHGYDWVRAPAPSQADLDSWHAMGAGVGIKTGNGLIAIDIDSLEPQIAEQAKGLAKRMLGDAPIRTGRAPKCLLVYRTAEDMPYQRVDFAGKYDATERIEALTSGRQFVASGIHPKTGKPYTWDRYAKVEDLTLVTKAQVDAYFAALANALPEAVQAQNSAANDRTHISQAGLVGDPDTIEAVVKSIPNTSQHFPTYDDYIRFGAAVKGACQHSRDQGLSIYLEWADRWEEGNDLDKAAADFKRIKAPYELGQQYLYDLADTIGDGSFKTMDLWVQPVAETPSVFEVATSTTALTPIHWINPMEWEGKEPKEREWEVEGWIPKGEVSLLYGDGGIGKTLLAHQYAICAAAGLNWLDQPTRKAKVMCFFCEDSEDELHRRQKDICRELFIGADQVADNLRIASRKYMDNIYTLWDRNTGAMKKQAVFEQLKKDALEFGANVIIVDTIADTFGGSEIDRGQVNAYIKSCLGELAAAIGGSVIALGHPSMSGRSSGSGTSGSTAWSNAARSRMYLRFPEGVTKGDIRELEGMKLNYGPRGNLLKIKWQNGCFKVIGAAMQGNSDIASFIPTIDDLNDRAVLEALSLHGNVSLSLREKANNYAPRYLKQNEPQILESVTTSQVEDAMVRLMKQGLIREVSIGKKQNRQDIFGYQVVAPEHTQEPAGSGAFD